MHKLAAARAACHAVLLCGVWCGRAGLFGMRQSVALAAQLLAHVGSRQAKPVSSPHCARARPRVCVIRVLKLAARGSDSTTQRHHVGGHQIRFDAAGHGPADSAGFDRERKKPAFFSSSSSSSSSFGIKPAAVPAAQAPLGKVHPSVNAHGTAAHPPFFFFSVAVAAAGCLLQLFGKEDGFLHRRHRGQSTDGELAQLGSAALCVCGCPPTGASCWRSCSPGRVCLL